MPQVRGFEDFSRRELDLYHADGDDGAGGDDYYRRHDADDATDENSHRGRRITAESRRPRPGGRRPEGSGGAAGLGFTVFQDDKEAGSTDPVMYEDSMSDSPIHDENRPSRRMGGRAVRGTSGVLSESSLGDADTGASTRSGDLGNVERSSATTGHLNSAAAASSTAAVKNSR